MIFAKPWADALIVVLVILLFFGPKRLPALGRSLGEGMREFKDSITGKSGSSSEDERTGLNEATPAEAVQSSPPVNPEPAASAGAEPESTQVASESRS